MSSFYTARKKNVLLFPQVPKAELRDGELVSYRSQEKSALFSQAPKAEWRDGELDLYRSQEKIGRHIFVALSLLRLPLPAPTYLTLVTFS